MAGPADASGAGARTATLVLSGLMMLLVGVNLGKILTGGSRASDLSSPTLVEWHSAHQDDNEVSLSHELMIPPTLAPQLYAVAVHEA